MRLTYSILYSILIISLIICMVKARMSDRPTKNSVAFLISTATLPILGNLILVLTKSRFEALIGYYTFFLGMDVMLLALVYFTNVYCQGIGDGKHKPTLMFFILGFDGLQMIANIFTGHAFDVEEIGGDAVPYFRLVPYWGQVVHRIIDYFLLFCVILIFTLAMVKTPKIYRERYTVILFTMVSVGLMQGYYLIMRSSYDRSVIGYGFFGIVIFYFAIIYRPLRFLDSMLSNIVSGLSDSFYVFDPNGYCVWANTEGCKLVKVADKNYLCITEKLQNMFGKFERNDTGMFRRAVESDDGLKFYDLAENHVKGSDGKINGYYLRIEDVTDEEMSIRSRDEMLGQMRMEAYRDPLTGVGSKAAYEKKTSEINTVIAEGNAEFAIVMVDMNDLKMINDKYGHKYGDSYIKGCCSFVCNVFKHSPVYRIGGDEFAVILQESDYEAREEIIKKLRNELRSSYEDFTREPWSRYSAAVGMSEYASGDESCEAVLRRADEAMYEEKKKFKEQNGSYR